MTDSSNNQETAKSRDPIKTAIVILIAVGVIMLILLIRNCVVDEPHYNRYETESTEAPARPEPDSGQNQDANNN